MKIAGIFTMLMTLIVQFDMLSKEGLGMRVKILDDCVSDCPDHAVCTVAMGLRVINTIQAQNGGRVGEGRRSSRGNGPKIRVVRGVHQTGKTDQLRTRTVAALLASVDRKKDENAQQQQPHHHNNNNNKTVANALTKPKEKSKKSGSSTLHNNALLRQPPPPPPTVAAVSTTSAAAANNNNYVPSRMPMHHASQRPLAHKLAPAVLSTPTGPSSSAGPKQQHNTTTSSSTVPKGCVRKAHVPRFQGTNSTTAASLAKSLVPLELQNCKVPLQIRQSCGDDPTSAVDWMPLQLKASLLAAFAFSAVLLPVRATRVGATFWRNVAFLCHFLKAEETDQMFDHMGENSGGGSVFWILWAACGIFVALGVAGLLFWFWQKRVFPPATGPSATAKALATAIGMTMAMGLLTVSVDTRDKFIIELESAQAARQKRLNMLY